MNSRNLLILGVITLSAISTQGATLFSDNFDAYSSGAAANTISGITTANFGTDDSITVSNTTAVSGANSLKYTLGGSAGNGGAGSNPDLRFALSTAITKDSTDFTIAFDFARGTDFDPNIWMMFGTGFGKGNVGIRNNGFTNFFDATDDPGFQYTGNNTLIFQRIEITYSGFTNDGTNITGWTTSVVTSGTGTENNPTTTYTVTGQSISSITDIRFQGRNQGAGDVYFDNVMITTSAIPEPSTFAVLAGLAALGIVTTRRRAVR